MLQEKMKVMVNGIIEEWLKPDQWGLESKPDEDPNADISVNGKN